MKRLIPVLAAAFVASLPVLASFGGGMRKNGWELGQMAASRHSGFQWALANPGSWICPRTRPKSSSPIRGWRTPSCARRASSIGMSAGQTSVYAMDQQGRQIAAIDLSIGRDIGELQQILRADYSH